MESPRALLVVVISIPILVLWLVIPKHSTETSIEFEKCLEQLSWTKCITYLRQLFSKIIDSSHARYKIGLSGTIERKDGKHVVFRDYFGNKLFQPPKENFMTPKIHIYRSEVRFMGWCKYSMGKSGK